MTEDLTSDRIRRAALSAAVDDLTKAYNAQAQAEMVPDFQAEMRLRHLTKILKKWPQPWTPESARARVGGTVGT